MYALDTQLYIEVLRGGPRAGAIRAFAATARPAAFVVLAPVAAELTLGARDATAARRVRETIVEAVAAGRRLAPDVAEWRRTGDVLRAMRDAGHDPAEIARRGFFLDVLVAVLCRARGVTLVTDDRDHERIRTYVGHRAVTLGST